VTRLSTLSDPEAAAAYAAMEIAGALREALERRGVAHLALAGGNTPRPAYELLAGHLDDWSAVELWYGDERCVGPDDPESNHRLVVESLLSHIADPGRAPREHRIQGELGPQAAAQAYAALLRTRVAPAVPGGLPVLDLALLGIGEDGHTASLFPGDPAVEDPGEALCLPVYDSPKPPPERVTLSLPVLRAARSCLLLVAGAGKAHALAGVLAGPGGPGSDTPASLLASERLHIVADEAAAPPAPSRP
jgi:6-phosphogluconolactonase